MDTNGMWVGRYPMGVYLRLKEIYLASRYFLYVSRAQYFFDSSRHSYPVSLGNKQHLLPICVGKIAFGIAFRRGAFRIPII
ncbi:hypothetical protein CfE428DRAFT_5638 [Chthoniobacter flavus Ellin428]|uniref:Uncharacterized protein n=1 Tax=Chthoniobacter flavus Ellin428 TaxID=497964 RepID=B4D9P8_9BACT|nr:hypothetical protein CfE428DRAFT_5638 [Chthoniobacter flavus Ellin428]TCO93348.1 hypothetical protein EV701_10450 [Chthoniobacter flavus]